MSEGTHPSWIHVVPIRTLLAVWAVLIVGTWLTVAATYVDLGSLNLWVAMAIATVKASLVALYFMHLRWDKPFNAMLFVGALLFIALFVGIAMLDTAAYHDDLIPGYAPAMEQ